MKELIKLVEKAMAKNMEPSNDDFALLLQIAQRAAIRRGINHTHTILMDLIATHLNGCKLDLKELLAAPELDFFHDVFGIESHLNRETGKLERFFTPRYRAVAA